MAAANKELQVPEFKWAQNGDIVYVQVGVTGIDSKTMKTDITKDSFYFYGEANKQTYELKFKFLHPVNPKTIKYKVGRLVEFVIEKETSASFWDGLLDADDKKRLKNRCTIDWSRWVEEDAEDGGEDKFGNMNDFNSMGGGGMPGMGGMGGMPGMGGMGGMPGMGGMGGMPGMGGMGGGGGGGMDMNALNEMMKNMKGGGGGMGGMGGMGGHDHDDHDHEHEHESGDSDDSDDAPLPDVDDAHKKSHPDHDHDHAHHDHHGHDHPHPHDHNHSEDHKHDEHAAHEHHAEKAEQQMESNPDDLTKNVHASANDAKDDAQDEQDVD